MFGETKNAEMEKIGVKCQKLWCKKWLKNKNYLVQKQKIGVKEKKLFFETIFF